MTFRSSIMEKMGTFPNEIIHIMLKCAMHLCGHRNKVVSFMKLVNISNGVKVPQLHKLVD